MTGDRRDPAGDGEAEPDPSPAAAGHVRSATDADAAAIAVLYRREAELHSRLEGGFELRPGFDWTQSIRGLMAAPHRRFWVAVVDDEILGFLYARAVRPETPRPPSLARRLARRIRGPGGRQSTLRDARTVVPFGVIEDVFVDPALRGGGLGTALVEAALSWLADEGLGRVLLEVSADNPAGVDFWRQRGFEMYRHRLVRRLDG